MHMCAIALHAFYSVKKKKRKKKIKNDTKNGDIEFSRGVLKVRMRALGTCIAKYRGHRLLLVIL